MKSKRIFSFLISMVLAFSAFPSTVFAAGSTGSDVSDADVSAGGTADAVSGVDTVQNQSTEYGTIGADDETVQPFDVYATKASASEVLLPKTVILNGAKAQSNDGYYVAGVMGDIDGHTQINLVPDSTVTLTSAGKKDISASITQKETAFTHASGVNPDSWTLTTGRISAHITAGSWSGRFHFNQTVKDLSQPIYSAADGYTGGYIQSGSVTASASISHTSMIPVTPGTFYSFTYPQCTIMLSTYDEDGNYLRTYYGSQLKSAFENAYCANASNHNDYDYESGCLTVPEHVGYLVFNVKTSLLAENSFFVFEGAYPLPTHEYTSSITGENRLTGKAVALYGDSIGEGVYSAGESFVSYIAQANGMTVQNKAVNGSLTAKIVSNLTQYADTYDYILVEGFINDCAKYILEEKGETVTPIGTLTPTGTTEFDVTTFTGQLENAIYNYQQGNHKAKLAFVLTYGNVSVAPAELVRTYWDAAIAVFEKYNINYLDLFDKRYSLCDSLHPNFDGQLQMARDVELWLNTL